jgi:hypothetical protein
MLAIACSPAMLNPDWEEPSPISFTGLAGLEPAARRTSCAAAAWPGCS